MAYAAYDMHADAILAHRISFLAMYDHVTSTVQICILVYIQRGNRCSARVTSAPSCGLRHLILTSAPCKRITCAEVSEILHNLCRSSFTCIQTLQLNLRLFLKIKPIGILKQNESSISFESQSTYEIAVKFKVKPRSNPKVELDHDV